MTRFENVIGYEDIKRELRPICDMIADPEPYHAVHAHIPHGLLLYGPPGVGKTMMATALMEESGRPYYTLRRDRPKDEFLAELRRIFTAAAENAPSIILLDDLDKFPEDDGSREEFAALQACIDGLGSREVFILATANDVSEMPASLKRAGRFDRQIKVRLPKPEESEKIIAHYLEGRAELSATQREDLAMMLTGKSCAELETLMNEASIRAGFRKQAKMAFSDILEAFLSIPVGEDAFSAFPEIPDEVPWHEAGHLVMMELLNPGSAGFAALGSAAGDDSAGFVIRHSLPSTEEQEVMISLAGKAACELEFGSASGGARSDIRRASEGIRSLMRSSGSGNYPVFSLNPRLGNSDSWKFEEETRLRSEMERLLTETRRLLARNRDFLCKTAQVLQARKYILHSEIRAIRDSCTIIPPEAA